MKQFDRSFLEQYKRNPRINSFYQNYHNPSAEGQYNAPIQPSVPNQFQAPMQQNNQVIEKWPEQYQSLLPPSMQGYNSAQVLQELQKAYQGNQGLAQQRATFDRNIQSQMDQQSKLYAAAERYINRPSHRNVPKLQDLDLANFIRATPNNTFSEANDALQKMYGNKYSITFDPIQALRFGYTRIPRVDGRNVDASPEQLAMYVQKFKELYERKF